MAFVRQDVGSKPLAMISSLQNPMNLLAIETCVLREHRIAAGLEGRRTSGLKSGMGSLANRRQVTAPNRDAGAAGAAGKQGGPDLAPIGPRSDD